jgi:hypothetical protein
MTRKSPEPDLSESSQARLAARPSVGRHRRWTIAILLLLLLACAGGYGLWRYHGPAEPVEIYPGIVYSCVRLPETNEGGGLVHLVRADLNSPGVDLFVTPTDPTAAASGWPYRLQYVSTTVREQNLAAAVNGTLFNSDSGFIRRSGDLAKSTETVVADHVAKTVGVDTYLLWWDDDRIAHLETTKPPSPQVLAKARWGIGAQQPLLMNGVINPWASREIDKRTMIAADPDRRLVWIAVFDRANYRFAAQTMIEQGAKLGVLVDGGTSCAMAIGQQAQGVRPGAITGNWRPVATAFGFREVKQ